jgi:DNA-binding MarR family transcriptional regulator
MVLACLYVVESADDVFLMRLTGLTWSNLSIHLTRLEEAGYIAIRKELINRKSLSVLRLTKKGRSAFRKY